MKGKTMYKPGKLAKEQSYESERFSQQPIRLSSIFWE